MLHTTDSGANEEPGKREIRSLIRQGKIRFGGNNRLRIYGTLSCSSGKRMKPDNRVFFETEQEAREKGFRPCGHCIKVQYREWKEQNDKFTGDLFKLA
ncbi:Ada metal-binding domain-containing protein [Flavitalea flava]